MSSETVEMECPEEHVFHAPRWTSGKCPTCSRRYQPTEDRGGNYWVEFEEKPGEWDES